MTRTATRRLHQKAVLREASGFDDYGDHNVGTPLEIPVRWEQDDREVLDATGNTISIEVAATVDRDVAVGSVMWLGRLSAIPDEPTWMEVVKLQDIPDFKGRTHYRLALLRRLSDRLPATT